MKSNFISRKFMFAILKKKKTKPKKRKDLYLKTTPFDKESCCFIFLMRS